MDPKHWKCIIPLEDSFVRKLSEGGVVGDSDNVVEKIQVAAVTKPKSTPDTVLSRI